MLKMFMDLANKNKKLFRCGRKERECRAESQRKLANLTFFINQCVNLIVLISKHSFVPITQKYLQPGLTGFYSFLGPKRLGIPKEQCSFRLGVKHHAFKSIFPSCLKGHEITFLLYISTLNIQVHRLFHMMMYFRYLSVPIQSYLKISESGFGSQCSYQCWWP